MSNERRPKTLSELRAYLLSATPEWLEGAADRLQAQAWRMMAAGDGNAAQIEDIAAEFRHLAERRRASRAGEAVEEGSVG